MPRVLLGVAAVMFLSACGWIDQQSSDEIDPSGHMTREDYVALRDRGLVPRSEDETNFPPIPQTAGDLTPPPKHAPVGSRKLVSVSVTDNMPVRDVLVELAREAKVNVELDPRIQGGVIFTAHQQPFDEVLKRICSMAGLRSAADGNFIRIELDEPYQQTYQLDFLSLSRRASSETSIATNVFDVNVTNTGSGGNSASANSSSTVQDNNSTSKVTGMSEADLWSEIGKSLAQILSSTGRKADREKADNNFSIDRQAGLVTVFGDQRQQDAVESYFAKLRKKATAQVLIDARIIEVQLDDAYKTGINWAAALNKGVKLAGNATFTPSNLSSSNVFSGSYSSGNFSALLSFVRSFGTTRVLSAPRLTVLNNQTAVLKVATNQVYFVTSAQFTTTTNANGATVTSTPVYTSTPHTVPVGLVMTVQPSIDPETRHVTMTLRPTISRVVSQVEDPSIGLNAAQTGSGNTVVSQIPVLAVREMDSVIRLHSGDVAVMGGLMQDSSINQDQGIPSLDEVPGLNLLAKSRDNQGTTTELVILLRAAISDSPAADMADSDVYEHFGHDPRPLPMRPAAARTVAPDTMPPEEDLSVPPKP